jgi:hypothetical protein
LGRETACNWETSHAVAVSQESGELPVVHPLITEWWYGATVFVL